MYKIISKKDLCGNIFEMKVSAPEVSANWQPGQFIILRINQTGERIPLTVTEAEGGNIRLVVQKVGKTTQLLSDLKPGDFIRDVLGPLGVAFEIKKYGDVVLVAGGVGIAVTYPIAKALSEAGNNVKIIYGVRNKEFVIMEDEARKISHEYHACSDDGSWARRGIVIDIMKELFTQKPDMVYTAGPIPMMKVVSEMCAKSEIKVIASINSIMVDGMGMCGSCRVTVDKKTKFACVDGPDFDGAKIDFADLIRRQSRFRDKEKISLEKYSGNAHK